MEMDSGYLTLLSTVHGNCRMASIPLGQRPCHVYILIPNVGQPPRQRPLHISYVSVTD